MIELEERYDDDCEYYYINPEKYYYCPGCYNDRYRGCNRFVRKKRSEGQSSSEEDDDSNQIYVPLVSGSAWQVWRNGFLDFGKYNITEETWNYELALYVYCKLN